jgi:hypothetical protein
MSRPGQKVNRRRSCFRAARIDVASLLSHQVTPAGCLTCIIHIESQTSTAQFRLPCVIVFFGALAEPRRRWQLPRERARRRIDPALSPAMGKPVGLSRGHRMLGFHKESLGRAGEWIPGVAGGFQVNGRELRVARSSANQYRLPDQQWPRLVPEVRS